MSLPEAKLYRLTATEVIARLKSGDFKVETYVRSLLSRIEEREPIVKAWAYYDPSHIIDQARRLDNTPREERGPLHGIPIGIKDVIYTQDMPTRHNSPIYDSSEPHLDAATVSILRRAGAIIFGKTATAAFAAVGDGPATRNPHDPERTPGGSSSGSGAAVADMHVPLALGTQTGGSVIRPASFNGIFGMKPTWGAISTDGQKIFSPIFDTVGVFARSADDLQLLADVFRLTGDSTTIPFQIEGSRFAVLKTVHWKQAEQDTVIAMETIARLLRLHGATVEEVELPPDFENLHLWHKQTINTDGAVSFYREYTIAKELLPEMLVRYVEKEQGYSNSDKLSAMDNIARLRPRIDDILRGYTAAITPSTRGAAPFGFKTGSPIFNSLWTALHTPVINFPGFASSNGLPIGLSLVSARYTDQRLLKVAKEVEKLLQSHGGWESKL